MANNRRGYAPVLSCEACGWAAGCTRCSARLVEVLDSVQIYDPVPHVITRRAGVERAQLLPKSGPRMVRVTHIFGVLPWAVAPWIVWPLLRPSGGGMEFTRIQSVAELEQKLQSPGTR